MEAIQTQIKAVLSQLLAGVITEQEAGTTLTALACLSNQMPIGKILRATEKHPNPGKVICRTNDEITTPNDLWEEIGLAWSGPVGYGSLPEGFATISNGILADLSADISGCILDENVCLGYSYGKNDFRPVITFLAKSSKDLKSLRELIDHGVEYYECLESLG